MDRVKEMLLVVVQWSSHGTVSCIAKGFIGCTQHSV
jgi:hypothetical protein